MVINMAVKQQQENAGGATSFRSTSALKQPRRAATAAPAHLAMS
jgi:hypothetical protein